MGWEVELWLARDAADVRMAALRMYPQVLLEAAAVPDGIVTQVTHGASGWCGTTGARAGCLSC